MENHESTKPKAASTAREHWERRARSVARQFNTGWFVQRWIQVAVPTFIIASCAILFARYRGWEPSAELLGGALVGLLVVTAVVAWLLAKKAFVPGEAAMVRLDSKLGLNNALATASADVCEWPDTAIDDGEARFRWRWDRLVLPGVLSVFTLLGALFLPIAAREAVAASTEEPAAWKQMEEWLETLEEEEIVEPESAEEVREQIDSLRDRPENEWFSHSSLEAGDSLQESLERQIQSLGDSLEMAEETLAALEASNGAAAQEEMRKKLAEQFNEAMEQMKSNQLKLDPNLMEQLKNMDPAQLKPLDPQQMKELRERLRENAGT